MNRSQSRKLVLQARNCISAQHAVPAITAPRQVITAQGLIILYYVL